MEKPMADANMKKGVAYRVVEPLQVAHLDDFGYETIVTDNQKMQMDESNNNAMLASEKERSLIKSSANNQNFKDMDVPIDVVNSEAFKAQQEEHDLIKKNSRTVDITIASSGGGYGVISKSNPHYAGEDTHSHVDHKDRNDVFSRSNSSSNSKPAERPFLADYRSIYEGNDYKCTDYKSQYDNSNCDISGKP